MTDSTIGGSTASSGLPIPPQEKVVRWLSHGAVAGLVVAGIIMFMPYVNKALDLLLHTVWSAFQLGMLAIAISAITIAVIAIAPAYKLFIESLANKATWLVLEYDPITPLRMWLKEVLNDEAEIGTQYGEIGSLIARNEQTVNDKRNAAVKARKLFAAAVHDHGEDSPEARLMALKPTSLDETANNVEEATKPLHDIYETLGQVLEATKYMREQAELDVDRLQTEYDTALSVQGGVDAATRVLRIRSPRQTRAMASAKIIHDKYAGNFGRLQSLRRMSQDIITNVETQKGASYQDAINRLHAESRMITGGDKPAAALPATVIANPGTVNGVPTSFYSVPKANSSNS